MTDEIKPVPDVSEALPESPSGEGPHADYSVPEAGGSGGVLDLDALEKVARAATSGPWAVSGVRGKFVGVFGEFHAVGPDGDAVAAVFYDPRHHHQHWADAKFFVTFDPPTVLRLIAERRELLKACREMVRLADMGLEEAMREPEEGGNFAAYNRVRAAIAKAVGATAPVTESPKDARRTAGSGRDQ